MRPSRLPRLVLTLTLGAFVLAAVGADAAPGPEPTPSVRPVVAPLEESDARLQRGLEAAIRALGAADLVRSGRMSVALVDLSSGSPRYAAVNGDRMIYAASLPKIAILLGAFDALRTGALKDSPTLRDMMTKMIRVSDNRAATEVLQRVGFEQVAATLTAPALRLYDADGTGGLWVGKAYGKNDYWRRDPIANLSHGATARQTARFLTLMQQGKLLSAEASLRIKEILGDPGIRHKFVRGLEARPGAQIFRKSGTWRDFHSDAALIERPDATYVAVGLVQSPEGGQLLERLIVSLDDLVRGPAAGTAVAGR